MGDAKNDKGGHEIELKLRVADLAALMRIAIASGGAPEPTATQRNQFFDTDDARLDASKHVLRLREESTASSTRFFVTAKGPSRKEGALSVVPEEEVEVDAATAAAIRAGAIDALTSLSGGGPSREALVQAMRAAIDARPLRLFGEFTNERTRIASQLPVDDGASPIAVVLELDRVLFPGQQVHHEVELEVPADVDAARASAAFHGLFARAGVVGRTAPGKARRFFQALRGERI